MPASGERQQWQHETLLQCGLCSLWRRRRLHLPAAQANQNLVAKRSGA